MPKPTHNYVFSPSIEIRPLPVRQALRYKLSSMSNRYKSDHIEPYTTEDAYEDYKNQEIRAINARRRKELDEAVSLDELIEDEFAE